ncbi:uncharacterized protein LOC125940110 [Dermacentor silvarum]|uniref:uncharacterized protein LOC125940110 n=1 Tax=Dermacentor silvarum TaxID=543639 RepID=UPI002101C88F|nr:uncharacterized protein LOC125940110 [Dermacentor silvarum]
MYVMLQKLFQVQNVTYWQLVHQASAASICVGTYLTDVFVGFNGHICADVETSQGSYCQAFPALTVPDESQQKVCAFCGGVQSAEGTANVTGNSTRSGDADPSVVAALQKRIATLEDCLKNMKRKVKTLQQQKSRANNRNDELSQNIRKYLSPDQLLGMETSSTRGTPWSTETIQKGLKLRLACGSRSYNTIRELAVPIPSERTLQRRVQNYKFSPGILHEVLQSLALKVK